MIFFTIVRNRATRGHSYKLFLPESIRVDVVSADSLPFFVGRLRSVDLGDFLVGGS